MNYAVVWSENDGPDLAGSIEVEPAELHLVGAGEGTPDAHRDLRYDELETVFLERCAPAKHPWEPALVLVTSAGDRIEIGSLEGLGALHELAGSVAHGRDRVAA